MLHMSAGVLQTVVAAQALRDSSTTPRDLARDLARALLHIKTAKTALHGWHDALGRACAPAVMQPGGLEAVEAWSRAWRAVAFAAGAAEGKVYTLEAECWIAAAEAADVSRRMCSTLPAGSWRASMEQMGDECRGAAVLAMGAAVSTTVGETPAVGQALGALAHIKHPPLFAEPLSALHTQLERDNKSVYFQEVCASASCLVMPLEMPPLPTDLEMPECVNLQLN